MPSDYQRILEDNLREYGQGTRHLAFLGRLYTDRTHFVYELLQNAEDANARKVQFNLYCDRLEVLHDGRPFNEADVRGISGVGEGTKAEDLTQIGKFGIGFKSVYAYTRHPEIHSGDEHFRIENYVRPQAAPQRTPPNAWTTLFVFPFDRDDLGPRIAVEEVAKRLRNLQARTLLFLRNIDEVAWTQEAGQSGEFLREAAEGAGSRRVTLLGRCMAREDDLEEWLVFSRPLRLPEIGKEARVEVAFLLGKSEETAHEAVIRLAESPLYAYFPTEKYTRVGFLLQGPYRTTPSRDNVPPDDSWNQRLVAESAELLKDALRHFASRKLAHPQLLEALPIQEDSFPRGGMLRPLFDQVKNVLLNEPLLPAADGSGVTARNAKLARGAWLRSILSDGQLTQLYDSGTSLKWLVGAITEDKMPVLRTYLIGELDVEEVSPEVFARRVSEAFFSLQTDSWMTKLYSHLSAQESLWREASKHRSEGSLRRQPFVRLETGEHVCPFQRDGSPNAYLPLSDETDLPVVKRVIAADGQAAQFLRELGLNQPDLIAEVVERVLPRYSHDAGTAPSIQEHIADMRKTLSAIGTDSTSKRERVLTAARSTPFLAARNAGTDERAYKRPTDVYFSTDSLRRYFCGNNSAWFLDEPPDLVSQEDSKFLLLGVSRLPRRLSFTPTLTWQEKDQLRGYEGSSRSETIIDYELDGLESVLSQVEHPSDQGLGWEPSLTLWNLLVEHLSDGEDAGFFYGTYEWFYYYPKSRPFNSRFLTTLRQREWLPTTTGSLRSPVGLDIADLPERFTRNQVLAQVLSLTDASSAVAIEIQQKRSLASALGVQLEDIELLKEHWPEFQKWKTAIEQSKCAKPAFPVRSSSDPQRREQKVAESATGAPSKVYDSRERSVRVSESTIDPSTWLRNQYTNDDGQMICQICEYEMPFKKRDGEYYFEAVEVVKSAPFEHRALFVALCPLCAAKFKEFVKKDEKAMATLTCDLGESDQPRIAIQLGTEIAGLRFVGNHIADLKVILRKPGSACSS